MKIKILILEDYGGRITEFQKAIAHLPSHQVVFWRDAAGMIAEMMDHLDQACLISLDHDLVGDPGCPDPGDGLAVAEALAGLPPVCPVVIHSTNRERVQSMTRELTDGGWKTVRVAPLEMGEEWIHSQWLPTAKSLLLEPEGEQIVGDNPIYAPGEER